MLSPKVKIQKSPDFTFAVGKIRVWESKLLPESIFYQLADSNNLGELESILNTTQYGRRISFLNFDESIDSEEIITLKELKSFLKDYRFILPFFYKRDFHNLKLLAKSKFTKVEAEWLKEGLIKKEIIDKAFTENDFAILPKIYQDYLDEAWRMYEKTGKWQILDVVLDKKLYAEILEVTEEFPFANFFFKTEIDLLNIKTLIRYKRNNADAELFVQFFIEDGLLGKSLFVEMYKESIEKFSERLKFTPYSLLSERGIAYFKDKGEFYEIEQDCSSVLLRCLSCAKYTAFGYEPLLRYIFLKINELRNLRAIFVSKLHRVESEEIKARIGTLNV